MDYLNDLTRDELQEIANCLWFRSQRGFSVADDRNGTVAANVTATVKIKTALANLDAQGV